MYCSHCGYDLKQEKIYKSIAKDSAHLDDISYLAKSLIKIKKMEAKIQIFALKDELKGDPSLGEKISAVNNDLKESINEINDHLSSNDKEYFLKIFNAKNERNENTMDSFVCPRCGQIIKRNLSEKDKKDLARAAHSEVHRGRNNISSGMCSIMIGAILAIIGFMFLALSYKATNQGQLDPNCVEFYVFIVLVILGFGLLGYGGANLIFGKLKINKYEGLLRDMNSEVFNQ